MLTPQENDLLCRSRARARWAPLPPPLDPVCLTEEVAEPDGAPVHARIWAKTWWCSATPRGGWASSTQHCRAPPRSLVMGRKRGVGAALPLPWLEGRRGGNVLEMASEPVASGLCSKVKHTAYPTREWCGFVWRTWAPPTRCRIRASRLRPHAGNAGLPRESEGPCNWAQISRARSTPPHSSLHSTTCRPRASTARGDRDGVARPSRQAPRLQLQRRRSAFATRRSAADRELGDPRLRPRHALRGAVLGPHSTQQPVQPCRSCTSAGRLHTYFYFAAWSDTGTGIDQERGASSAAPRWAWTSTRNTASSARATTTTCRTACDEAGRLHRHPRHPVQDMAMVETMGPTADRSRDRLGASDLAIVEFRRIMVEAVKPSTRARPRSAPSRPRVPRAKLRSFEVSFPRAPTGAHSTSRPRSARHPRRRTSTPPIDAWRGLPMKLVPIVLATLAFRRARGGARSRSRRDRPPARRGAHPRAGEGARREGEVMVSHSTQTEDLKPVFDAFTDKYGVKVGLAFELGERRAARDRETRAGKPRRRLHREQLAGDGALRRERMLRPMDSPHFGDLRPGTLPAHREYATSTMDVFVHAYNTRR